MNYNNVWFHFGITEVFVNWIKMIFLIRFYASIHSFCLSLKGLRGNSYPKNKPVLLRNNCNWPIEFMVINLKVWKEGFWFPVYTRPDYCQTCRISILQSNLETNSLTIINPNENGDKVISGVGAFIYKWNKHRAVGNFQKWLQVDWWIFQEVWKEPRTKTTTMIHFKHRSFIEENTINLWEWEYSQAHKPLRHQDQNWKSEI